MSDPREFAVGMATETGTVINRGTINVDKEYGVGMFAGKKDANTGKAYNEGTINVTGKNAYGIQVNEEAQAYNSGIINVSGNYSNGIRINSGSVTNKYVSGKAVNILGTAADSTGIAVINSSSTGINNGKIVLTATGGKNIGMYGTGGGTGNRIENTGANAEITMNITAGSENIGASIIGTGSTFSNSGKINLTDTTTAGKNVGIYSDNATVNNTGEVNLTTKGNDIGIYLKGNSIGTIGGNINLTSTGSNITLSIRHIRNYLKTQSDIIVDQKSYEWAIANSLRSEVEYAKSIEKVKPYVLIIDEINRGNISRIFGELITLIEDSKRQGADDALSVTLPYSKDDFSVPDNVYIIGTMNSSDRSLTGLDIALRRRFTFIEMPPKPEFLTGVEVMGLDIRKLLEVINQRIEVLLDRDHCIGHANFMTLQKDPSLTNLAQIFKQKIIPQLQEYFFDDWSKINMVLNANGMLRSNGIDKSVLFPNVAHESESYFEEQKIWEVVDDVFNSIESFTKIIKH